MLLVGRLVELLELRHLVLRVDETVEVSEIPSYDTASTADGATAGSNLERLIDCETVIKKIFTYPILSVCWRS